MAIEVFEGNTADPKTLKAQIDKLKTRFGLSNIALVGDRGMLTSARIRDELRPAQLDWISALRADQIRVLVNDAALQLSLFDEQNLFEITHPDYPHERLVCCHNPALADERARKRAELLAATETQLQTIATATRRARRPLRGQDKIALRVGKVRNKFKMAKHFDLAITEEAFTFTRNQDSIAAEAALDGIYVLRTSLPEQALQRDEVVLRYKDLADVERFFRTLNTELDVRPIRHRLADRVRAHMFLRMLSYYISWHMKHALAPILFTDNDKPAAAAKRADPVAPAPAPIKPSARQRANAPKTITRCTASPACSPTWPPCAPTTSNPPTTYPHSPSSPPHPATTARLRPTGRCPPPNNIHGEDRDTGDLQTAVNVTAATSGEGNL